MSTAKIIKGQKLSPYHDLNDFEYATPSEELLDPKLNIISQIEPTHVSIALETDDKNHFLNFIPETERRRIPLKRNSSIDIFREVRMPSGDIYKSINPDFIERVNLRMKAKKMSSEKELIIDRIGVSKSLHFFCGNEKRIDDMVAYALYKFDQSNWAVRKDRTQEEVANYFDNLYETRAKFKQEARALLNSYNSSFHDEWRESTYNEIVDIVYKDIVVKVKEQLNENELNYIREIRSLNEQIANLKNQTSTKNSIAINVISGILSTFATVIITAAIYFVYSKPSFEDKVKEKIIEQSVPAPKI